jgi:hypothetical protein
MDQHKDLLSAARSCGCFREQERHIPRDGRDKQKYLALSSDHAGSDNGHKNQTHN